MTITLGIFLLVALALYGYKTYQYEKLCNEIAILKEETGLLSPIPTTIWTNQMGTFLRRSKKHNGVWHQEILRLSGKPEIYYYQMTGSQEAPTHLGEGFFQGEQF